MHLPLVHGLDMDYKLVERLNDTMIVFFGGKMAGSAWISLKIVFILPIGCSMENDPSIFIQGKRLSIIKS